MRLYAGKQMGDSIMHRADILRMARESDMDIDDEASGLGEIITAEPADLARFSALVAAAEREACAQIADEWATREQKQFGNGGPGAAIRARGKK